jgi:hypothetical protein
MAPIDTDSVSSWVTCGKKTPRSEVVFLCQILILYTVIVVSIHNLAEIQYPHSWYSVKKIHYPCHSVPFARLTRQTVTLRFCRSCLKIQLLEDSWYRNHLTKYWTLRPFFLFFKMDSILYTSSVLMTFCNSSAYNVPSRISPVAVWSVSFANGTEWHGQCIVLGDLWKDDSKFGGRIFVSGTRHVHGYRS